MNIIKWFAEYGWALIIIVVAMGIVVFVVTNPSNDQEKYIRENCENIGTIKNFSLKQGGFGTSTKIEIVLYNNKKILSNYHGGLKNIETNSILYRCKYPLSNKYYMVAE